MTEEKKVEVTPIEKALHLIEHGHFPPDTDPLKLAEIIEKKTKKCDDDEKPLNDISTVFIER